MHGFSWAGCSSTADNEEILKLSMRQFSYIRCYDSFELLATLKVRGLVLVSYHSAHKADA